MSSAAPTASRSPEAWLILLRTPGLGAVGLRQLLARTGGAEAALEAARYGALEVASEAAAHDWLREPDRRAIEADLDWLTRPGHSLICCDEPSFPALLEASPAAPAALFVAGDAGALWQPQIAIVGSRSASQAGLANARSFARGLAAAGFTITSGLAEGVDGAAHAGALDAGALSIAVLGSGPDRIYPPKHRALAARIEAQGALISEFPPGTPPHPSHFPRRNRIIAGLALGTVVVEAGLRSGSLITARLAGDAGREVFALPGSIHNPLARGCHQLIRQGARLVETTGEIIAELAPLAQSLGASLRQRLAEPDATAAVAPAGRAADPDYARLYAALGHETLSLDQLAERSGLAVGTLSSMLLLLELEGEIVAVGGAWARRIEG